MARAIRVHIHDKEVKSYIRHLIKRVPKVMDKTMSKISQITKRVIAANIPHKSTHGARHSTPVSLRQLLHRQKNKNMNYSVFFDKTQSNGKIFDLADAVEYGTRPHPQPLNPIFKKRPGGQHPGAKPTYFFRHSINQVEGMTDRQVRIAAKNILK